MVKIIFLISFTSFIYAKSLVERVQLGELKSADYSGRFEPFIMRPYLDNTEIFLDHAVYEKHVSPEFVMIEMNYKKDISRLLQKNINCSDQQLLSHQDYLRFLNRLLILSYSLENMFQLNQLSKHFDFGESCSFNISQLANTCTNAKSDLMKKYLNNLKKVQPEFELNLAKSYGVKEFISEIKENKIRWSVQNYLLNNCRNGCELKEIKNKMAESCQESQKNWKYICDEKDNLYGLSGSKDAYYLIGLSHALNNLNKEGEGLSCLQRYSETYKEKENYSKSINRLIFSMEKSLRSLYQQRYLLGQSFIYGSAQEFESKLATVFKEVDPVIETPKIVHSTNEAIPPKILKKQETKPNIVKVNQASVLEVPTTLKTAFLEAADQRRQSNLKSIDVDMLKFKYDYVFSLNAINNLTERLKIFMSRDALNEMVSYDKLGSKQGPVPLLFLKFMIDQQEHQGLWNLVSVLGPRFYVSNELDTKFKTLPEFIELKNDQSTQNQWQIIIRSE